MSADRGVTHRERPGARARRAPGSGPASPARPDFPAGRIVGRCAVPGLPFAWRIDPYPGVDPGFPLGGYDGPRPAPVTFDEDLWTGETMLATLERDLEAIGAGEAIAIGAAGDPYPLSELRARRTRRILEALVERDGFDVGITTKSDLVARDAELLARLAEGHAVSVHVVIPTLDRRLARTLDPEAPRPDLRLKAVSELAARGVDVRVRCAPVLPDVTDEPDALDRIARAAAGAGARGFSAQALHVTPSALAELFPSLGRDRPDRVERHRARYEGEARLPAEYRRGLADLVARLRRKHGMDGRVGGRRSGEGPQLDLF
ncbi:MAG: radical SAM protein [Gemmatimonadota bacterium]|nr:radical SAM protein [Gemmatimonadota bacterium]